MGEDPDRELEHYVWQHKHEPLRKIREGMEKEFGRTKSTKWIKPRRDAAIQAEQDPELEVELPTEEEIKDEGEDKDETRRDEETKIEEDSEIIETDEQIKDIRLQRRRVEAKIKLQQEQEKLALAKVGRQKTEDLVYDYKILTIRLRGKRRLVKHLKQKLEKALELNPNYYPNATCPECDGRFLWRVGGRILKCYVCGRDYKRETD